MPQYIRKTKPFTADTGGTLDWQISFEDPFPAKGFYGSPRPGEPNFYGFLGIGKNKKEEKARQDAMNDVRRAFPGATNCADATTAIARIRKEMADSQAMVDSGESPNVAPRYIDAYNTVLTEYIAYFNTNCLKPVTPLPTAVPPVGSNDPVLQTALPSVNTTPSTTNNTAALPIVEPVVNNIATGNKKIPIWAWVGGGIAALGLLVVIIKKST